MARSKKGEAIRESRLGVRLDPKLHLYVILFRFSPSRYR